MDAATHRKEEDLVTQATGLPFFSLSLSRSLAAADDRANVEEERRTDGRTDGRRLGDLLPHRRRKKERKKRITRSEAGVDRSKRRNEGGQFSRRGRKKK